MRQLCSVRPEQKKQNDGLPATPGAPRPVPQPALPGTLPSPEVVGHQLPRLARPRQEGSVLRDPGAAHRRAARAAVARRGWAWAGAGGRVGRRAVPRAARAPDAAAGAPAAARAPAPSPRHPEQHWRLVGLLLGLHHHVEKGATLATAATMLAWRSLLVLVYPHITAVHVHWVNLSGVGQGGVECRRHRADGRSPR